MLCTFASRAIRASATKVIIGKVAVRSFAAHAEVAHGDAHAHGHGHAAPVGVPPKGVDVEGYIMPLEGEIFSKEGCPEGYTLVVEPALYDSLEWTLSSPPPIHQFIEPPIIVEIEHLDNLVIPEDI